MDREELSKLISDVAADLSQTKEVWTSSDLADALLAALDEAGIPAQWKPISEAPTDRPWLVLAFGNIPCWGEPSIGRGGSVRWLDYNGEYDLHPTHFIPLPPPPKENSNES